MDPPRCGRFTPSPPSPRSTLSPWGTLSLAPFPPKPSGLFSIFPFPLSGFSMVWSSSPVHALAPVSCFRKRFPGACYFIVKFMINMTEFMCDSSMHGLKHAHHELQLLLKFQIVHMKLYNLQRVLNLVYESYTILVAKFRV